MKSLQIYVVLAVFMFIAHILLRKSHLLHHIEWELGSNIFRSHDLLSGSPGNLRPIFIFTPMPGARLGYFHFI